MIIVSLMVMVIVIVIVIVIVRGKKLRGPQSEFRCRVLEPWR
jgi:hypothetical protein